MKNISKEQYNHYKEIINKLLSEYNDINDEFMAINDDFIYEQKGERLYQITWELLNNKFFRDDYPEQMMRIFLLTFQWATTFADGVSFGLPTGQIKSFMAWIRKLPGNQEFGKDFENILDDWRQSTNTLPLLHAWSVVIDLVRLMDPKWDPVEYYDESINPFLMGLSEGRFRNYHIGKRIFTYLSMVYVVKDKETFLKVLESKKDHLKYIRAYAKPNSNVIFRLFERYSLDIFKSKIGQIQSYERKVDVSKKIYHYTSPDVLYDILVNKRIKMSDTKRHLDNDEGKILKNDPYDAYTLSFTKDGDSVALWGNYTNNMGVALEFKYFEVATSFTFLKSFIKRHKDSSEMAFFPFNIDEVSYGRDKIQIMENSFEETIKLFRRFVDMKQIKVLMEKFYGIQTHFMKVAPFKYEKEVRLLLARDEAETGHLENAEIIDGELYLKINPKQLIKRVIMSPTLKLMEYEKDNLRKLLEKNGMGDLLDESAATIKPK